MPPLPAQGQAITNTAKSFRAGLRYGFLIETFHLNLKLNLKHLLRYGMNVQCKQKKSRATNVSDSASSNTNLSKLAKTSLTLNSRAELAQLNNLKTITPNKYKSLTTSHQATI